MVLTETTTLLECGRSRSMDVVISPANDWVSPFLFLFVRGSVHERISVIELPRTAVAIPRS